MQRALIIREELVRRFPYTFAPKGSAKRPLKIGISKDIRKRCPDLKRWHIHLALWDYCNGPSYLAALATIPYRYDLDGNPCEAVLPQHAADAAAALEVKPEAIRSKWTGLTSKLGTITVEGR